MNKQVTHHQFACYYAHLATVMPRLIVGTRIQIDDAPLAHRISSVLRMAPGETVLLFNQDITLTLELAAGTHKKQLSGIVKQIGHNHPNAPAITVLLPVLKREALEDALYSCVELGANTIQLITTTKTHKLHGDEKLFQRLSAIIIAAAEQSKNFVVPTLKTPLALPQALAQLPNPSRRFFFHPDGQPLNALVEPLHTLEQTTPLVMLVGPEGDCTQEEQHLIDAHQFTTYRLTPTVLRAQQALTVGLGALRSLTSSD